MDEDTVSFSGSLNSQDIAYAARPQFIRMIVMFVALLFIVQIVLPGTSSNWLAQAIIFISISLVFTALVYVFSKLMIRRAIRNTPIFNHPIQGSVGANGIRWQVGDMVDTKLPWPLIPKTRLTEVGAIFNIGPGAMLIVPRRFLKSDDDWNRLENLVRTHAPGMSKAKK